MEGLERSLHSAPDFCGAGERADPVGIENSISDKKTMMRKSYVCRSKECGLRHVQLFPIVTARVTAHLVAANNTVITLEFVEIRRRSEA